MLFVLDYASKIDAGLQTYEPSDAFKGLEVAPDGVSCFQDGLLLLVVRREQVELDRPTLREIRVILVKLWYVWYK